MLILSNCVVFATKNPINPIYELFWVNKVTFIVIYYNETVVPFKNPINNPAFVQFVELK